MNERLPDIARSIATIRERHALLLESAKTGAIDTRESAELASLDADLCAFDDMCRRTRTHNLMSTGLRWNDELRHPAAPGTPARVRISDTVEYDGVEMTIAEATTMVARAARRGVAIADWSCGDIRLGSALGLEHPPRDAGPIEADAVVATPVEAVPATPMQASLF